MVDWFNITLWSVGGTWALVVGTLVVMYWQTREAQRLNSANAVMALRERFDGQRMRAARRHLADRLLRLAHDDIANVEVVSFFELVGALTHRKVLDLDLVWEAFGTWVEGYYTALRKPVDLIEQLRTTLHDPLVFHEFEWLYDHLVAIDRKRLGPEVFAQTETADTVTGLLRREVALEAI